MLPCAQRLQPLLALLSSALLTRGHSCPPRCLCPNHHTVDCSARGLSAVPDSVPLAVRRLLLSNNWISWIPSDFLVLFTDLVYLDLRNNSLSQLELGTLSSSPRLAFLDLSCNNLSRVLAGTFEASRSLVKLRLGDNPWLSTLDADSFAGLSSLRELELQRDALAGLEDGVLEPLRSLRLLRLDGNPWSCSCQFARLFSWLTENRNKLPTGLGGIECLLPEDGRRVPLNLLSEENFRECRGALTLTDHLVVVFSGICVSVAAIVASFLLASTVHCFHRLRKGNKADEEDGHN